MATGQSLIERALRLIVAIGTAEPVSAIDQTNRLADLNAMLDSWNAQRPCIYSTPRTSLTLQANHNPHTIVTGGDFNVTRPPKIESASILDSNQEYPLNVLSRDEYQAVTAKLTTSTIPTDIWYDPAYPLGNIHLYPVPSTANGLILYPWTLLTTAITWAATLAFPPGYEEAIVYNFAIRVAPEYGRSITEEVAKIARDSLTAIRALNIVPHYMTPDPGVMPPRGGSGRYDITTNRYR